MVTAARARVNLPVLQPAAATAPSWDAYDPMCLTCGRRRSRHARPIEVDGGELIVPSCELRGDAMFPEGPAERRPRPLARRLAIARSLTIRTAHAIAGTLGAPSKMPGAAYGIDAFQCQVGDALAAVPGSVCHGCYARKNFYAHWWPAMRARQYRQASLGHDLWVEALIALIEEYLRAGGEPFFRWHDSGDIQSASHMADIAAVCEATPRVRHWMPTREYKYVDEFRRAGGVIPPNLAVRLSAHWIGKPAKVTETLRDLPTSTVHEVQEWPRAGSLECGAYKNEGKCGDCRACWDPKIRDVGYLKH